MQYILKYQRQKTTAHYMYEIIFDNVKEKKYTHKNTHTREGYLKNYAISTTLIFIIMNIHIFHFIPI